MSEIKETLANRNKESISNLEKAFAVNTVKMDNLTQQLVEIKTNHLVHINDSLSNMSVALNTNNTEITKLVNDRITEVYRLINNLKISDAEARPNNKLFTKIIEYIVLGVIGVGIAYISRR